MVFIEISTKNLNIFLIDTNRAAVDVDSKISVPVSEPRDNKLSLFRIALTLSYIMSLVVAAKGLFGSLEVADPR